MSLRLTRFLALSPLICCWTPGNAIGMNGGSSLVSASSAGIQGNGGSLRGVLSHSGTSVAFISYSDDLVLGDTNARSDVFLRDLSSGATTLVSVGAGQVLGNSDVTEVFLSGDGGTVAWTTSSSNLVQGDTNGSRDIFVRDLATNTTERVSVSSTGAQANFHSEDPWLSFDGRFVAFGSQATNLVNGDNNGSADVFVHDRSTGSTIAVSVSSAGVLGQGNSAEPSMDSAGRFVAFSSIAPNLVGFDTNMQNDVFLHDLQTSTTTMVSVSPAGVQGDSGSRFPRMSHDGSLIVFESDASTFDATDTNGKDDVYLKILANGVLERVSVDAAGASSVGNSTQPSISGDGRYVSFAVAKDDFDPLDTNGKWDVYRKDRQTGALQRVSLGPGGQQDDVGSGRNSMDASGNRIVFYTNATTFLTPDRNGFEADVYLVDCAPIGTNFCNSSSNSTGSAALLSASGSPSLSIGATSLNAGPVPDQMFLFVTGPLQVDVPFGNGRLCVGGPLQFLGPPTRAVGQVATKTFDPAALGFIPAQYHFQCWFRDTLSGGARFDTSDGFSIAFVP